MGTLPLDNTNPGSSRRLPPSLNLGSSRKYNNRPSYNVTVHRKKLHAVTELDNQGFSDDFSSESGSSSPSQRESPSPHRHRRSSTDDRGMLRALREDSSVFNILKLYDEDGAVPPAAFSNSPLRPEFEVPGEQRPPKSDSLPHDPSQDSSLISQGRAREMRMEIPVQPRYLPPNTMLLSLL
ncbi:hypothetical protein BS47DRAFT_1151103 [Hydnum rufescens UP504]|uniref:Uncharacterized protein n=1 Tax=Hydnum rufescens UP504 TaxID=1448309 RepID=A0A9P6B8I5_9AGAM|nr:hypothetical protein BS47DRAFT_1151103 [Hydnum rufescens UP504]